MTKFTPLSVGLALPIVLMSQAAFADLTPTQVWGDWRQYMESMGYDLDANEVTDGGNLTVSNIAMSMELPDDAGDVSMVMGTISFVQNGDGSVNVVMPDVMPVALNISDQSTGEGPVSLEFEYTQSGQSMTVSGSPDEMTYVYSADTFGVTLAQLEVDGEKFGQENAKVDINGSGISSSTVMTMAALRGYQQTGSIAQVNYDVAIDNPEEDAKFKMNGSLTDVAFDGGGAIPLVIPDVNDMAAMLKAGFAMSGTISYGAGAAQVEVTDPNNGNFAATTSSTGGNFGVEMGEKSLAYSGEQNGLNMNVKVAELPFPVELNMARSAFNLDVPISKSNDPQGFAFGITLGDFTMSDMIWSIFDPAGQLPRDPATILVDLNGQVKVLVDLMDPESAAAMAFDAPGEIHALTIDKVLVSAVGAKVEGSGDFTFDNADTTTYPGMPKPVGSVDLSIAGANGLMDKLVAMGLLPEQQAMGARMMMGLFAVAGDAPDTLKSKVEMTSDGQILANGQRIK